MRGRCFKFRDDMRENVFGAAKVAVLIFVVRIQFAWFLRVISSIGTTYSNV